MTKKKIVIKPGDWVQINNPEFVTKVGYEYDFKSALEEVEKTYGDNIRRFTQMFDRMLFETPELKINLNSYGDDDRFYAIQKALAKDLLRRRTHYKEGLERKLFTVKNDEFADKLYKVRDKKIVRLGKYHPPKYYSSVYDGEDCDPAYISGVSKVILILGNINASYFPRGIYDINYPDDLLIDEKNVTKINEEKS